MGSSAAEDRRVEVKSCESAGDSPSETAVFRAGRGIGVALLQYKIGQIFYCLEIGPFVQKSWHYAVRFLRVAPLTVRIVKNQGGAE